MPREEGTGEHWGDRTAGRWEERRGGLAGGQKVDRAEDQRVGRSGGQKVGRSEGQKVDHSEDRRADHSEDHWVALLPALMEEGVALTPLQEGWAVRTQPLAPGSRQASKESTMGRRMGAWALLPELKGS